MSDYCIIVLGMHRSGTSCLTGMLEQAGVHLGEVHTANPFNKKGNRESAAIQALNNRVLEENGGAWDSPVDVVRWTTDQARERDDMIGAMRGESSDWWGFKDPRVVLTLPFWLEGLAVPSFIGTFRHPLRVAASLVHRDRMSMDSALDLWLAYNRRLLDWQARFNFELVDFDLEDDAYKDDVAGKLGRLGVAEPAGDFFDADLRHQRGELNEIELPLDVARLYATLKDRHELV